MKKLTLLILTLAFSVSQAQNWFDNGTTWYYDKVSIDNDKNHGYSKYEVTGDTLINGKNAKKITITSIDYDGTMDDSDPILVAYEENQKIYFWDTDTFLLRYDFSLSQGDTSHAHRVLADCEAATPLIIDTVWTDTINGEPVLAQTLSFTYEVLFGIEFEYKETVHQGLGVIAKNGFKSIIQCANVDAVINQTPLRCYTINGENNKTEFWTEEVGDFPCDTLINTDNVSSFEIETDLNIYPNPFENQISIRSNELINSISLSDVNGKTIMMENLNNKSTSIQTTNLTSGIYLIRLNLESGKTITQKVIK